MVVNAATSKQLFFRKLSKTKLKFITNTKAGLPQSPLEALNHRTHNISSLCKFMGYFINKFSWFFNSHRIIVIVRYLSLGCLSGCLGSRLRQDEGNG